MKKKPKRTSNATRTAVYVRVSTGNQNLASQLEETRRYCKMRNLKGITIYQEKVSAVKHRPELERMMQDVRDGNFGAVVVYKLDRLGRSLTHMALIIEELAKRNVALVCTSQGIDTIGGGAAGKLQLGVLLAVAEFERELIRERTKAGLNAARKRGSRLGRPPKARMLLSRMQKMRRENKSMRTIAKKLRISLGSVGTLLNPKKEQRRPRRSVSPPRPSLSKPRGKRRTASEALIRARGAKTKKKSDRFSPIAR